MRKDVRHRSVLAVAAVLAVTALFSACSQRQAQISPSRAGASTHVDAVWVPDTVPKLPPPSPPLPLVAGLIRLLPL
jgi:hypothetical protein